MDKLFKMLERGEMPDFAQMLQALNDVSDVDWHRVESLQLSIEDDFEACRLPEAPCQQNSPFCETC